MSLWKGYFKLSYDPKQKLPHDHIVITVEAQTAEEAELLIREQLKDPSYYKYGTNYLAAYKEQVVGVE